MVSRPEKVQESAKKCHFLLKKSAILTQTTARKQVFAICEAGNNNFIAPESRMIHIFSYLCTPY